jgi:hypothetical protein
MGLLALSSAIGRPVGNARNPVPQAGIASATGGSYYFLWSVERVAMALGLETFGGKDWYNWGAEILVANQRPDGSWQGQYAAYGADTCFALLFLSRANFTGDLTVRLKGRLRDPSKMELRTGGTGGSALRELDIKTKLEPGGTPGQPEAVASRPKPVKGEPQPSDPIPVGGPRDPVAAPTPEARRLIADLVGAPAFRLDGVINRLRDGKGVVNTEALAGAIPLLSGDARRKVRDALAERLSRMKNDTLGRYLKDEEAEIRRAAALALAMRESRSHIPDLIELLSDPNPVVVRGAHAALKDLTGEDHGTDPAAWRKAKSRE